MPNVEDTNESANSLSDQHKHSHNTESWSSWMIQEQNTSQSEAAPQDGLCQENDSPSCLIQSAGYSLPSVATDNSLDLPVGLLAIAVSSQDGDSESSEGKHERHSQTLLLVDSVNSSDDVKSSSTTIAPYSGAVLRGSGGAVLKKFNDSSKGSKGCPSLDKNLKMKGYSISPSKDALVSDEDISPHSLAPPPPPPTPNVVLADGQEHKFIISDSASEAHAMAPHLSGHLNSWPVALSLPCPVKRTSALNGAAENPGTLQMKDSAAHAIPNSTSHHCSEFEIDEDSAETIPDSPSRHLMYGMSGRINIFEDTVASSPVGTTLTKELTVVKHTYVNSRFNNMSCGSGVTSSAFVPSPSCSHVGPVLSVSHSSITAVVPASLDNSSNVCSAATARISTSSSLSTHQNQCFYTTSSSTTASASSVYTHSGVAPVLHLSSSVVSTSSTGAIGGAVGSCPCGHIAVLPTLGGLAASVGISVRPTPSNGDRQSNTHPGGTDGSGPVCGGAGEAGPAQHQRPLPVHNAKAGPMYNWQAMLTTVKERFAFLFNNDILSDVQFVVGRGDEEQNVPAHKFVLAVGSAVFDAMFNGQLASQQQVIHLPDVEPQAFLALLSFLYSDEVQIGPETVMTVLYTAKKYAVPALERRCVDFLQTNLSSDNAFMLLTQARLFDEPQLAALCLKTIDKCTAEAIVAEGFTDIDHDTLVLVLQRDTLRIKELHLYQAVCRWAEAECHRQGCGVSGRQQRSVLGQALQLIRFPLMTVEEFAQGPAQSGILTDAEVVQLFLYFSVNPKPSVDFIDVPRCCMTGKEQTMCRFQSIEARWGYSGTPDRIRFIVDRRIFVVGFGMYGSIHGPSEYEVTVQLIHTLTGKVCGSNETVFTSDGTVNTFRVMFPDPIEVLPNTNYTAYATLKGPDSHYGTKGMRKVVVECPSGDRVCFQFSFAAGNNNGTSVEDGQIPEIIFYT